jgi:hypothetical protein
MRHHQQSCCSLVYCGFFTVTEALRTLLLSRVFQNIYCSEVALKIELNVEILEGHLGCMKSTHSMNAATWGG